MCARNRDYVDFASVSMIVITCVIAIACVTAHLIVIAYENVHVPFKSVLGYYHGRVHDCVIVKYSRST